MDTQQIRKLKLKPEWITPIVEGQYFILDFDPNIRYNYEIGFSYDELYMSKYEKPMRYFVRMGNKKITFVKNFASNSVRTFKSMFEEENKQFKKCRIVFVPTKNHFILAKKCFPGQYVIVFNNYCESKIEFENLNQEMQDDENYCNIDFMHKCIEKTKQEFISNCDFTEDKKPFDDSSDSSDSDSSDSEFDKRGVSKGDGVFAMHEKNCNCIVHSKVKEYIKICDQ